jgi:Tol biopolymer transport system component
MSWRTGLLVLPALTAACGSALPAPTPVEAGFAMVAPGVVSTDLPEFAVTVSPDGNEMYFNRASADRSQLSIMVSRQSIGQWTAPEVAPFSGTYRDVDPFIAPDGRRLYFSSNRPRAGMSTTSFSTWYVERTAKGWGPPIDPGAPLNSDSSDIYVSVSRAGELYFSSSREGSMGIYMSRNSGGKWSEPVRVDLGGTTGGGNPMISPDGKVLLVTMRQPGSDVDIMYSCRTDTGWTPPQALPPPVNSPRADFAPAIDLSGGNIYFTSERPGMVGILPDSIRPPGDLYRIPLKDAGISCP